MYIKKRVLSVILVLAIISSCFIPVFAVASKTILGQTPVYPYGESDNIKWYKDNSLTCDIQNDAAFNGEIYVSVGQMGSIMTSKDGLKWESIPANLTVENEYFMSIIWDGNRFIAASIYGRIALSSDGISWSITATQLPNIFDLVYAQNIYVAVGIDGLIATSPDAVNWTVRNNNSNYSNCGNVIWNGNKFVTVGNNGLIAYSSEGINWTFINSSNTSNLHDIAWNGLNFVAVGDKGTILCSSDCITWENVSMNNTIYFKSVTWCNNMYIITDSSGNIYESSNGTNWSTGYNLGSSYNLNKVIFLGNKYIGLGAAYFLSYNGTDWQNLYPGRMAFASCIDSFDSKYTALGTAQAFSSNGVDWTSQNYTSYIQYKDVANDGTKFISVGGEISASTDGTNWSSVHYSGSILRSIIWSGNQFIAVGDRGTVITSTDGYNWSVQNSGVSSSLRDILWDGNKFIAVGDLGTIIISTDGKLWNNKSHNTSDSIISITFDGNSYYCVTNENSYYRHVISSIDCTNWSALSINGIDINFVNRIKYVGGELFAYGPDTLATSINGLEWHNISVKNDNYIKDVIWDGSKYIALGDNGFLLIGYKKGSTAIASSGYYNIDQSTLSITDIPYGTSIESFKSNISPSDNSTICVYKGSQEVTTENIKTGMNLVVTSEDKYNVKTYSITVIKNTDTSVMSTIYKVDSTDNTIKNAPYGTTVSQLLSNLVPAEDSSIKLYNDKAEVTSGMISTGMTVFVTAEDNVTTRIYTITIDKNTDTSLYSSKFTIDNANLKISNIPYNTSINDFIGNITLPYGATCALYDDANEITDGSIVTGIRVVVTAEDQITKSDFQCEINKNTDVSISSAVYGIKQNPPTISKVLYNTSVTDFISNIQLAKGATIKVLNGSKQATSGSVNNGMTVVITAEDTSINATYKLVVTPIKIIFNKAAIPNKYDPIIKGNTVLSYFGSIAKKMGIKYTLNSKAKTITLVKNKKTVIFKIESKTAVVSGKSKRLDTAPIIDVVPYLPIKFICSTYGFKYSFDSKKMEVTIV